MVSKSRGKKVKGVKSLRAKTLSLKNARDVRGGKGDTFLKIDGIKGESIDRKHKVELDLE